jgi:mannose-1-phosphate guanylyltransferase
MKAVVLVGGEGTRLRPLTLTTPKQLLPVAEVPMVERLVAHLARHGVDHVVLSLGYRPDAFARAFPARTCAGVPLRFAVEHAPLDTAGAIRFAAGVAGIEEPFLVVNGDVLTDLDVTGLVAFHRDRGAEATIALTPVDDPSSFGVVEADDDGRVRQFVEKPPRGEAPSNLINAGTYVLEPSVLDRIPEGRRVSIERETFPALIEAGRLFARASRAYWIDTGTPALYLRANLDLVAGRRGGPPAPGAKEREPGVWTLGAGVIDGRVEPPSLVGDAAFVGAGARVSGSVVGAGARVEAGARVTGSVLLPGAVVHEGAVVEESILGEGALVQEGARVMGLSVVPGDGVVEAGAHLAGERLAG